MDVKFVDLEELSKNPGRPAQTVSAVRMVVVTGAFPYKKQLEEFRKALHFDSIADMLRDREANPEFMGLLVERRTVQPDGQNSEWAPLDIEGTVKQLRIKAVGTEKENLKWLRFGLIARPNRLVMPRPKLARNQEYPPEFLPAIEQTVAAIEKANEKVLPPPPPKPTRFESVDPYSEEDADLAGAGSTGGQRGAAGAVAGAEDDPELGGPRRGGGGVLNRRGGVIGEFGNFAPPSTTPAAPEPLRPGKEFSIPDECLVRFLDVTVRPGETYQYRVKVRMANPSYQRVDRAIAQKYTEEKEVVAEEWTEVVSRGRGRNTTNVTVPDELYYYATDEKVDRPKPVNAERAAVQIHRWLEAVRLNPNDKESEVPVGDWTVLARLLVHRGEYVGRKEEAEVPVWRAGLNNFVFAVPPEDEAAKRNGRVIRTPHKGIPVDFATDPYWETGSVLVDFAGGKRTVMSDGKPVTEDTPVEMLVLNADGKLIVRNSRSDTANGERLNRYNKWKTWTDEVRRGSQSGRPQDNFFQRGRRGEPP
jgi:hypothetical protein